MAFYTYDKSPLYNLYSKEKFITLFKKYCNDISTLNKILKNRQNFFKKVTVNGRTFYILRKKLKSINGALNELFSKLETPEYLFSKKGKSYILNAQYHEGNDYVFKLDISKFFPSIKKSYVYNFYVQKLKMAPSVANLICKFTVFNNHLAQGISTSSILSFLVNQDMFNKIYDYTKNVNLKMSVYVDDITFSSNKPINSSVRTKIIEIIKSYGYKLSSKKIKYFKKGKHKVITGVILSKKNKVKIPNKIRVKFRELIKIFKNKPDNIKDSPEYKKWLAKYNKLLGYMAVTKNIEPNAFTSDYNWIKKLKIR